MAINGNQNTGLDINWLPRVCSHCGREFDATAYCPETGGAVCYKCCWKCTYSEKINEPGSVQNGQRRCALKANAAAQKALAKKAGRRKK